MNPTFKINLKGNKLEIVKTYAAGGDAARLTFTDHQIDQLLEIMDEISNVRKARTGSWQIP